MNLLLQLNDEVESFLRFVKESDVINEYERTEDMKQRISKFVNIAKQLELYIIEKQLEEPTLEQKVELLRQELNQKNELLLECKQKILEWSDRFHKLESKQKNVLYEDIIEVNNDIHPPEVIMVENDEQDLQM